MTIRITGLLSVALLALTIAGSASASSTLQIACGNDAVGAEILVNGKFKGDCPLDVKVQAGNVKLKVVQKLDAGAERVFEQTFRLGDDVIKRVDVVLSGPQPNAKDRKLEGEKVRREQAANSEGANQAAREKAIIAEALNKTRADADGGNPDAQYKLGSIYEEGLGVPLDKSETVRWYLKAAEQGHALAQGKLARMYVYGTGTPKSYAEAARWAQKAAEQGDPQGQTVLGAVFWDGLGVQKDVATAIFWTRKAADQEWPKALVNMAEAYDTAYGVPLDKNEALRLYNKAAAKGSVDAMRRLGTKYEKGNGVPVNKAEAFRWWLDAAKLGEREAQYNVGLYYDLGRAPAVDYAQAAYWYRKAAEQDQTKAQNNLALLHFEAHGVAAGVDREEAERWLKRAAELGDADAKDNVGAVAQNDAFFARREQRRQAREREAAESRDSGSTMSGLFAILGATALNYAAAKNVALPAQSLNTLLAQPPKTAAAQKAIVDRQVAANSQPAPEPPKYQPQVVTLPKPDLVCPPGSTWHNAAGVGAKGGTCYADAPAKGQTRSGASASSSSDRPVSASGTTTRPQTPTASGGATSSDVSTPTTSERQPPKTVWGPIQLEALAICRKGEKNGKWWCDGPVQDDIIFDSPTVEDALSTVGCSPAISAAGGTTKDGKQDDVYRCGYGLRSYDRNIAKIHRLVTAQRSYICPQYEGSKCTTFYDGQDKR
jgi:TPR repeat protein